jgi:CHAT domain-containing protein/tetratricopeptide (TPR) repeat protein
VALWVIIDARARPDLIPFVTDPERRLVGCEQCGSEDLRQEPVLVLLHDPYAPIGLLLPGANVSDEELAWISEAPTVTEAEAEPWRIAETSYATASIALARSPQDDLRAGPSIVPDIEREYGEAAAEYVELLETLAAMAAAERRMTLVGSALATSNVEAFRDMLSAHPVLLAQDTLQLLDDQYAHDQDERIQLGRLMLREAKDDPEQAWHVNRKRVAQMGGNLVSRAEEWIARVDDARGDPDLLIEAATGALRYADEAWADDDFRSFALGARADGHRETVSGRRDEHLAAALADYQAVLVLTPDGDDRRPGRMQNVAVAIGEQVDGDERANARIAEKFLREALELVSEDERPELVAMLRTNLALALMRSVRVADTGPLQEARTLCEAALQYRSPERDIEDWAYTVINLGAVIERLAGAGEASLDDARATYQVVLDRTETLPGELVAHTRVNVLRLRHDELRRKDEDDQGWPGRTEEVSALIRLAREVVSDLHGTRVTRGRAARTLAQLLRDRAETSGARDTFREAIQLLRNGDLQDFHFAAWELATMHSEAGEWEDAAGRYREALAAARVLVERPGDAGERARQADTSGRLWRWAAHAYTMTGATEEAVLALEDGRTRELRRQLQLEDPKLERLEQLVPQAATAWRETLQAMAADDADPDKAGRELDEALAQIRAVPGFERFAASPDLDTVSSAAHEHSPAVYINPTPYGTSILRVSDRGDIQARVLEVTSAQVTAMILFGVKDPSDAAPGTFISYALAAAGNPDDMGPGQELPDIADALDRVLPWIGERICAPVEELLLAESDREPLLIPCGVLATVPLVAAPYGDDYRCLLDRYTVSTTPSASTHATARRRAATAPDTFDRLVAVADPTEDLEFSRTEVAEIATRFHDRRVGHAAQATRGWLIDNAGDASTLHLACHGFGGLTDATRNGFVLADGSLTGPEVARLGPLHARLAVASACQTAVTGVGDGAEEAFSLGSALLAAGVACVIATLWSVRDLATAMLMTRLYELLHAGQTPAQALVSAQRWLRDIEDPEVYMFIADHPRLRTFGQRGLRAKPSTIGNGTDTRPFAHPENWAGFVALGA